MQPLAPAGGFAVWRGGEAKNRCGNRGGNVDFLEGKGGRGDRGRVTGRICVEGESIY
jgi:hypothetical protein